MAAAVEVEKRRMSWTCHEFTDIQTDRKQKGASGGNRRLAARDRGKEL